MQKPTEREYMQHAYGLLILALTGLTATIFWESGLLLPVKLLVVLVHEIWHGLSTLAFGGYLQDIHLDIDEAGETLVSEMKSSSALIVSVSAGYIGSTLTGGFLLNRGLLGRAERLTLGLFTLILFYMCFLFTELFGMAFYVGICWGCILLLPVIWGVGASRLTLLVLGGIFVWYCMYDLFDFTDDVLSSDAGILARYLTGTLGWDLELSSLAYSISLGWSLFLVLLLALFLLPVMRETPSAAPVPEVAEEPESEPFPGEITPELQAWFLSRGLGPDGEPLGPELIDLQQQAVLENDERRVL